MADDLTALLRQTLREDTLLSDMLRTATEESGRRWLDALAARLAEVVEGWMDLQWYTWVVRERDAAREAEAEAVALVGTLWTRHGHRQTCPIVTDLGMAAVPRWVCNCGWDEIARRVKTVLARRKEHPVGKAQEVVDG